MNETDGETATTRRQQMRSFKWRLVEAGGDFTVLLVFVLAGISEHRSGLHLASLGRNILPLVGSWFAVAAVVGTYSSDGSSTTIKRVVVNWLLAVPLGIAVRAMVLGRQLGRNQLVFASVALVFTGAALAVWRTSLALVRRFFGAGGGAGVGASAAGASGEASADPLGHETR
jgi:hypothetical protein